MAAGGIAGTAPRPVVIALSLSKPELQHGPEAPGARRQQDLAPAQLWGWWGSRALQAAGCPCPRLPPQLLAPLLQG